MTRDHDDGLGVPRGILSALAFYVAVVALFLLGCLLFT